MKQTINEYLKAQDLFIQLNKIIYLLYLPVSGTAAR